MKMETIIIAIITFFLGMGTMFGINYFTPPKQSIQNVYNYTTQENKQETTTTTMQGQVTVIIQKDNAPVEYLNVNLKNFTNITVNRSTNTNYTSITN